MSSFSPSSSDPVRFSPTTSHFQLPVATALFKPITSPQPRPTPLTVSFSRAPPHVLLRRGGGYQDSPSSASAAAVSDSDHPSAFRCNFCYCCPCGRRRLLLLGGASSSLASLLLPQPPLAAVDADYAVLPTVGRTPVAARRRRPEWYEEFYARAMEQGMSSYEAEIADYKAELFARLRVENKKVLEVGVGTGPNLKYYANAAGIDVYGVDPNKQMEKYARTMAVAAGLPSTHFKFIQGVGEALPIIDDSMDVVVGTLVLCSVQDVDATLREVKRVLKPGGLYIFIEHVAAQDGSSLRLLQSIVDPLQQFVVDGCHLTRETGKDIAGAGFSDVSINRASLSTVSIISPHVYGIACK